MTTPAFEPLTVDNYWEFARCREIGPEIFDWENLEGYGTNEYSLRAMAVCARCEVLELCKQDVLRRERGLKKYQLSGVVAGMPPAARLKFLRQHGATE